MLSPMKIVNVTDGSIVIFGSKSPQVRILELKLTICERMLFLIINQQYCIPVEMLPLDKTEKVNVYLAGSSPDEMRADVFGVVTLDGKMIGKILACKEMYTEKIGEKTCSQ